MIEASAPVRICDIGGWTDTWFGGPGRVVNVAASPGVEISIGVTGGPDRVVVHAQAFGDRYAVVPGAKRTALHPLLEAAIDAFPPPGNLAVEVAVRCSVPAGCGTGTSAAVAVALVGALAALRSQPLSVRDVAYAAYRLEVDVLGVESGIQDQLSVAHGGINYIEVEPYPEATVSPLPPWDDLSDRLTVVYLGRAHNSSDVHRQVIEKVGMCGSGVFAGLRDAALAARQAVLTRDLHAFGEAMTANTEELRSLHPGLVGVDAHRVIEHAAVHGAIGWKVNGAGGDGGSVTVLNSTGEAKGELEKSLGTVDTRYRVLPVRIDTVGLEVRGGL